MRLEPLHRCIFAPTESWHVILEGVHTGEVRPLDGGRFGVVLDAAELVREPLAGSDQ